MAAITMAAITMAGIITVGTIMAGIITVDTIMAGIITVGTIMAGITTETGGQGTSTRVGTPRVAGEHRMKARQRGLLLGLAAGHLILVALGAGSVSLRPLGPVGRVLDGYGALSGAGTAYVFFAPGVGGQLVARFDVIDAEGRRTEASLETGSSHEADLRVGNIIDQFWHEDEAPGLGRVLAASLAGKIFARRPEARAVVVRLSHFEPVSMEAFRRGDRPASTPMYEARFAHRARATTE